MESRSNYIQFNFIIIIKISKLKDYFKEKRKKISGSHVNCHHMQKN